MKIFAIIGVSVFMLMACSLNHNTKITKNMPENQDDTIKKVTKTEAEWKAQLSPEAFRVLRQQGTEYPFKGEYDNHFEKGTYVCAGCKLPLFKSDTKYNSGCGWPAFYDQLNTDNIVEIEDNSHGMRRVEVRCASCDGHLGHVFEDGPRPTGLRYCINSVSLDFIPDKKD